MRKQMERITSSSMARLLVLSSILVFTPPMAATLPVDDFVKLTYNRDFDVPADGSVRTVLLPEGDYTVTVSGTYHYGSRPDQVADAEYVWGYRDWPLGCYDHSEYQGEFDLAWGHYMAGSGNNPYWGACDATTHTYRNHVSCHRLETWTVRPVCVVSFVINDPQPNDNSGALRVTIDPNVGSTGAFTTGQGFDVPATGEPRSLQVPPGPSVLVASGMYRFGRSTGQEADAGYSYDDVACTDPAGNLHDLLVNGVSPWSRCDMVTHTYEGTYHCLDVAGCVLTFRIHDSYHGDNSGSLHVEVHAAPDL